MPQIVADHKNEIGEGPIWHPREQVLYWLDIPNGQIFKYDPATNEHGIFYERDGPIGGITLQQNGSLLLFMEKGAIAELSDGKLRYLVRQIEGEEKNRFNDMIADPAGRVFCGTMPTDSSLLGSGQGLGTLFRIERDGGIEPIIRNVGLSNGMGFSPDHKKLYYTDSTDYKIYVYDYDQGSGAISNQNTFIEVSPKKGLPDGMTVDSEGNVWCASAGGSTLTKYSTNGSQLTQFTFPARMVTSAAFGGGNLDDIYVTTIGGNNRAVEGAGAGALFRIRGAAKGLQEFYSDIAV